MDGVNEVDENGKISNLLDPDAKKVNLFGRKSQNWLNLRDEDSILLKILTKLLPGLYEAFRIF
ncbi:hypothetical protein Hanom_Chr00s183539g01832541 [Helianthus anomalus]